MLMEREDWISGIMWRVPAEHIEDICTDLLIDGVPEISLSGF